MDVKWTYGLSDDYRVATFKISYLIIIGIIMQVLKFYKTILACLN